MARAPNEKVAGSTLTPEEYNQLINDYLSMSDTSPQSIVSAVTFSNTILIVGDLITNAYLISKRAGPRVYLSETVQDTYRGWIEYLMNYGGTEDTRAWLLGMGITGAGETGAIEFMQYKPTQAVRARFGELIELLADVKAAKGFHGNLFTHQRTGFYYIAGQITTSLLGSASFLSDRLFALPMFLPRNTTLDRIGIYVQQAAAGNIRLGIYNSDENCYPSSLVLDAGTVSTSSTGLKTISLSEALTSGLYWLVFLKSSTSLERGLSPPCAFPLFGMGDSGTSSAPYVGWVKVYTYGSLPATFPADAGLETADPFCPAIYYRASSFG